MPPELEWSLPEGVSLDGPLLYPAPTRFIDGELVSFGYADEVMLLQECRISEEARDGDTLTIRLRLDWLICKDLCLPATASLALALPVKAAVAEAPSVNMKRFAAARRRPPAIDAR